MEKRSEKITREQIADLKGQIYIASDALEIGLIDKQMTEAELMEYLTVSENRFNPSSLGGVNIKREANVMKLADLLKENPEAQKEHDALVKAQREDAVKADRERGKKILSLSGISISSNVLEAFESGMDVGEFAVAERERELEAIKKAGGSNKIGAMQTGKQVPASTEVKGVKNKDANIKASVDEFLNKGEK